MPRALTVHLPMPTSTLVTANIYFAHIWAVGGGGGMQRKYFPQPTNQLKLVNYFEVQGVNLTS